MLMPNEISAAKIMLMPNEISAAKMCKLGFRLSSKELSTMMCGADGDGDGLVSYTKFCAVVKAAEDFKAGLGWYSHSDTTLYISLVILHTFH